MRRLAVTGMALTAATLLVGCSGGDREENVEGFVPPTITARGDYESRLDHRFERLDANGDGVVARDELPARRPERVSELDADGDGRVTQREFVEGRLRRFDRSDANRDGTLTTEERRAAGQR